MTRASVPNTLSSKTVAVKDSLMHLLEAGAVIGADEVAWCKSLSNLTAVNVGGGLHFLPEDRPDEIGRALAGWLGGLE